MIKKARKRLIPIFSCAGAITALIFFIDPSYCGAQSVKDSSEADVAKGTRFASLYFAEGKKLYSDVSTYFAHFDGDFNRPQLPSKGTIGVFEASGFQKAKTLLWRGLFRYTWTRDHDQLWRNSVLHPDAQPFIWSDEGQGIWERNHFKAEMSISSAYKGEFQWGIGAKLEGGQGDRDNDPKPLYRFRLMALEPDIAWKVNEKTWVAWKLRYASFSEDNEVGFFSIDDPLLYRLRGYGTFSRTPFVSGQRLLTSQQLGGGVRIVNHRTWLAEVNGFREWGTVEEGTAITESGGEWQTLSLDADISKSWESVWNKRLSLLVSSTRTEGTDPIFQSINSRLAKNAAHVVGHIEKGHLGRTDWMMRLSLGWDQRTQEDLATRTDASIQSVPAQLSVLKQWNDKALRPFLGMEGYHQFVVSSVLDIGNETEITDRLIRPDFQVLSSRFYTLKMLAGLELTSSRASYRVLVSAQTIQSQGNGTLSQNAFGVSLHYSPSFRFRRSLSDHLHTVSPDGHINFSF